MSSAVSTVPGFSAEKRRVALHSMLAAAAMTFSSVSVILNALRLRRAVL